MLFVVGGLLATWIGLARHKPFARSVWFRGLHLAAIAFVVAESVLGIMCPLTEWEAALRGDTSGTGFIQRWIHAWLFWDFPPWGFSVAYTVFGGLVLWTWIRFPPGAR